MFGISSTPPLFFGIAFGVIIFMFVYIWWMTRDEK